MKVSEKINYLLQEKDLTKRDFARKLLELEPKLDGTGKSPSESTIYGYLNGGREIKIELIPYIAEVLEISEQELFTSELEYATNNNIRFSKEVREIVNLLPYAPHSIVEHIREILLKYKSMHEEGKKAIR